MAHVAKTRGCHHCRCGILISEGILQKLQSRTGEAGSAELTNEAASKPWASFGLPLLAVLLCCGLLYVAFAVYWVKFSRAEVFFAECAREMIAQNNMITPLYHHKPFFDKPILVYWLIVGTFQTLGITHLTARIPSILAGLATVALTAYSTRHLATQNKSIAGLLSAMLVGSSFMFFSFAYLCMSDMFLVMFDTATMALLYLGIQNERRRNLLWWLAAVSMGFGFITKGPIGIVLPAVSFIAFLAVTRQLSMIKLRHVAIGAVTATLIAVPWFYAAYQANGTWALAYFFIRENFQRYAGATYDTHKPIWFMVQSLIFGFLPWSVLLPPAVMQLVNDWKDKFSTPESKHRLYLWIWTAAVTGFFSLSRGKCDYYVLPVYPAVAALVALYLTEKSTAKTPRNILLGLSGLVLVGGLASPIFLSRLASNADWIAWWMLPVAMIVCGAAGVGAASTKRVYAAVTCLFLAICMSAAGFAAQLLPVVTQSQSFEIYATAMKKVPLSTNVAVHTNLGHWIDELTFQIERDPVELTDSKSVAEFLTKGPSIALMPEHDYQQALVDYPSLNALHLKVLDKRAVSSHPLTPGYLFKRKGKLLDKTLVLVFNQNK